jgi:hypothetical protein
MHESSGIPGAENIEGLQSALEELPAISDDLAETPGAREDLDD